MHSNAFGSGSVAIFFFATETPAQVTPFKFGTLLAQTRDIY